MLERHVRVVVAPDSQQETLLSLAGDAHGVLVRSSVRIGRQIIEAAQNLEVIARTGAGIDNIDVAAATQQGILVCHLPGLNARTAAEHAVTLLLALAKQLPAMDTAARARRWEVREQPPAMDVFGKVLGVIGVGNIGTRTACICAEGLGMQVLGYDPRVSSAANRPSCVHFVDNLPQLVHSSDFISLHVPASPQTYHLIDQRMLARMKPTAYLINTSRGEVVDEAALTEALEQRTIAGAGLDVFTQEPPEATNRLLSLPTVILSPHVAALTQECVARMSTGAAQAIIDVFSEQRPRYIANEVQLRDAGFPLP